MGRIWTLRRVASTPRPGPLEVRTDRRTTSLGEGTFQDILNHLLDLVDLVQISPQNDLNECIGMLRE